MVGFYGYKPFTPHSTLAESINLFRVLISYLFYFSSPHNKEGEPLSRFIVTVGTFRAVLLPVHSPHHVIYAFCYFSPVDTATSYFSLRGQTL